MRQVGTIAIKQDAERFASYLLTLGISAKVEPSADAWSIWIHDENQISRSKEELDTFKAQPSDPRYQAAEHAAREARREAAEKARQARRNYVDMRNEWANPWRRRRVTMLLIITSVLVALVTDRGTSENVRGLLISTHVTDLDDILHGQAWRLVTPIFVHFGLMHLLFNMLWLIDLGTVIEGRLGWLRFAALVLLIAVISNIAQFVATGPLFGGMSGVVYGLFAYAWIRGRTDPNAGMFIHPNTVMLMIGWFFVCLFGLLPGLHVANTAHGVGLAVGAALGYLPRIRRLLGKNT